jgi:hypothetical protein
LLDGSDFFCFFHFLEKLPKPNGPPSPNADKLMVAAFAAKGLNLGVLEDKPQQQVNHSSVSTSLQQPHHLCINKSSTITSHHCSSKPSIWSSHSSTHTTMLLTFNLSLCTLVFTFLLSLYIRLLCNQARKEISKDVVLC